MFGSKVSPVNVSSADIASHESSAQNYTDDSFQSGLVLKEFSSLNTQGDGFQGSFATEESIDQSSPHRRIKLNICGMKYEITLKTLTKYPQSRLGKIALLVLENPNSSKLNVLCDSFHGDTNELFFERDPSHFPMILNYFIHGKLHLSRAACNDVIEEELKYWEIPLRLEMCCQWHYCQGLVEAEAITKKHRIFTTISRHSVCVDRSVFNSSMPLASRLKQGIWNLFENPGSSKQATILSFISTLVVILSTTVLVLHTDRHTTTKGEDGRVTESPLLYKLEISCIAWFTFEYICRFFSAPNKTHFLKSFLNSIDLLSIAPFYVGLSIYMAHGTPPQSFDNFRRALQILRIVRIFKVARYSIGLQILGYSIRQSSAELSILLLLLLMGMLVFSSMVYFAEGHDKNTHFKSIVEGFWWAIISMTTVGYGDMYPKSALGKVAGSLCCVSGMIFLALPIPSVVNRFSEYYRDHRNLSWMKLLDKAKELEETSDASSANERVSPEPINTLQL